MAHLFLKTVGVMAATALAAACSEGRIPVEEVATPQIAAAHPEVVLPGTRLVIEGSGFATEGLATRLAVRGTRADGSELAEAWLPATVVDDERIEVAVDRVLWERFGGGRLSLQFLVVTATAGTEWASQPYSTVIDVREYLDPGEPGADISGLVYVNDRLLITGSGFLLGGDEGQTFVRLDGCVDRGGECEPIANDAVPLSPLGEFDRSAGTFPWLPQLSGLRAGAFEGSLIVENRHPDDTVRSTQAIDLAAELAETKIDGPAHVEASLGQYIDIEGAGFVETSERGATLLHVVGELQRAGTERPEAVDLLLVPHFSSGRRLRYVLAEDDALGGLLDLRAQEAVLTGTVEPIVSFDAEELTGTGAALQLDVGRVKQVVYLQFTDGYKKSLGLFGMAAADQLVRDRVAQVLERDYEGLNLDVRLEPPSDFALFSTVDIGGFDPNGLGLLGNDNTPGKDVGNRRLHDRLGGVNALTQFDGYPGYGGVFIESLFVYSGHPIGDYRGVDTSATADERFDRVFDAVRQDRRGEIVAQQDLEGQAIVVSTDSCTSKGRSAQVGCATWVLGSLIGTTLSHEVAHSLGLADPYGGAFHNFGDGPNRLMDRGSARPFGERAELDGEGPALFCTEHYDYLRAVLPAPGPAGDVSRPSCL